MNKNEINLLIKNIQIEITNSNPNYKYTDYCKQVEVQYWNALPEWIVEFNDQNKINKCLDIGCAMGTLLMFVNKISQCDMYALDLYKHLSDDIINRYDVQHQLLNVELQDIPYDESFDTIIFTEVLEHLKHNPVPTLKKINKILNDDGRMFFSCPNVLVWGKLPKYLSWKDMPMPEGYEHIDDFGHEYHYSIGEVEEILKESGFKIMKYGYSPQGIRRHINLEIAKDKG